MYVTYRTVIWGAISFTANHLSVQDSPGLVEAGSSPSPLDLRGEYLWPCRSSLREINLVLMLLLSRTMTKHTTGTTAQGIVVSNAILGGTHDHVVKPIRREERNRHSKRGSS